MDVLTKTIKRVLFAKDFFSLYKIGFIKVFRVSFSKNNFFKYSIFTALEVRFLYFLGILGIFDFICTYLYKPMRTDLF